VITRGKGSEREIGSIRSIKIKFVIHARGGEPTAREARVVSMEPEKRKSLSEVSWQDLNERGAYVEIGNGNLYRVTKEGSASGGSPS
jgi:hypothetical protein